jgi:hypothetical protein
VAYHGSAVLPVGSSLNPAYPQTAEYYADDLVVYVMWKTSDQRTRPTRVLTSYGALSGWTINSVHELYHDQTGAQMGSYKVVGVKDFKSGESTGMIPNIAIKHAVFK